MSLFKCEECGVVENTALCGWAWEPDPDDMTIDVPMPGAKTVPKPKRRRRLICSQCNPEIGKWHNRFPRQDADEAGYTPIPGTRYIELPFQGKKYT